MILNLSKSTNSLQQYDYYNTFKVATFNEYDRDDENDSVDSTIPRQALEQKNKKILLKSNNKFSTKRIKKSIRFDDDVERFPSSEPAMTEEGKHSAWYSVRELQTMKKQAKAYAKFVGSIDSKSMNELLHDMTYDVDDDINDKEIICLRGLEKYANCQQTSSVSSGTLRRMLVQNVLLEQSKQKIQEKRDDSDNENYDDDVKYSDDELICKTSMAVSKNCRDFAYQIAQKSYCIPAFV